MSKTTVAFEILFPQVDPKRLKKLMDTHAFRAVEAIAFIGKMTKGHKEFNTLESFVLPQARTLLRQAGYNSDELTAAFAVAMGSVLPPKE